MAETIIGLSQSNAQMRTTIRYLDQIQRSTDRLGRTRYQSLIKTNNELRTTGRRLESIYSTAVRLSRLRIMPKIGLIDELSPALDRALAKLNSVRGQMVKASGTVLVDVKQKVEVEMGKLGNSTINLTTFNNTASTTASTPSAPSSSNPGWMDWTTNVNNALLSPLNNATDLIIKWGGGLKKLFSKKDKNGSDCNCCCGGGSLVGSIKNRSKGGKGGKLGNRTTGGNNSGRNARDISNKGGRSEQGRQQNNKVTVRTDAGEKKTIITKATDKMMDDAVRDFRRQNDKSLKIGKGISGLTSGIMSGSPLDMMSGNSMFSKISNGLAKGAGKMLGPLTMVASVANIATAPPEERGRAVGSMIGGTAGTAIGSAIGSVLLPGIGTWVGGAVGGWAGSEVGGWIGDKAKDIGNFMSSATEGVGNALSGAADFVAEKTKNIFGGITDFFGGSKKEEAPAATTPAPVPSQPMPAPPYIPEALSITGPKAYLSGMGGGPTAAALAGPNLMQMQAMGMGTGAGAQAQATGNGQSSSMTVQISEEQMSSLAGYLTDFKTEVTNQVSVNVPAGAVQVTVRENAIDYDALALQIGGRLSNELRRAMENRRSTVMA